MLELSKWDLDVETNDKDEYTSLVRAVRRTHQRFKLLFVSCSPSQGEKIRCDLMADIPTKKYELLDIKESIDNLYEAISNIPNLSELDVLFIRGLEYSIFEYEDKEFGDISKRSQSKVYGGTWAGVPPVLAKLNMQRELFRDRFSHICFVFLLPHFAIDYFIRRAPDFYDWKSGIYRFATNVGDLQTQLAEVFASSDYNKYACLTSEEKLAKIREIRSCLDEINDLEQRFKLLYQLGLIYLSCDLYSPALDTFDHALVIEPYCHNVWYNRGVALSFLGKHKDAIHNYCKAIFMYPNDYKLWNNLGYALSNLKFHQESIEIYKKAISIQPNDWISWSNIATALSELGNHQEAVSIYDLAIKLNPSDYPTAWFNRGRTLRDMGRYEEAMSSYDRAIQISPNFYEAWHTKGLAFRKWGKYQEALDAYQKAITIKPDKYVSWHDIGFVLFHLDNYHDALAAWQEAFKIISKFKPSDTSDLIQEFIDEQLLPKFQQPAVRDILPQIITIYTTAQVLPELGAALTRNLKAIQSPTISDYTATEWLKMWQELGKLHPELALALRMLEAGVKYKQNPTDDRVFLSLPQEMRPLLWEALGLEP
jgi:tetratricopeptide (TPR) repeat protein